MGRNKVFLDFWLVVVIGQKVEEEQMRRNQESGGLRLRWAQQNLVLESSWRHERNEMRSHLHRSPATTPAYSLMTTRTERIIVQETTRLMLHKSSGPENPEKETCSRNINKSFSQCSSGKNRSKNRDKLNLSLR
jgi:hypothetical protein